MTNLTVTLNLAVAGEPLNEIERAAFIGLLEDYINMTFPSLRTIGTKLDGWQERERQAGTKIVNH
jgi:hypothetical protein